MPATRSRSSPAIGARASARCRRIATARTERVRSLAWPLNLVGVERDQVARGDVVTGPGRWAPTSTFDVQLRAVRGLAKPLTARGAFKVYAGAAEADALVRFLGATALEPGGRAFARVRTADPLVLAVGDRLVVREAGRRETVAGGLVLDIAPGKASRAPERLEARLAADPADLPALLVRERGAVPVSEVPCSWARRHRRPP